MKPRTCQACGKEFTPFRTQQRYCSMQCRKRAENWRGRQEAAEWPSDDLRELSGTTLHATSKLEKIDEENQRLEDAFEGARSPAFIERNANWIAVNEITHRLNYQGRAIAWALYSDRQSGWFGRVRDERGDWSFGPSTIVRVHGAVESWIRQEPFEKREGEKSWRGDCMRLV